MRARTAEPAGPGGNVMLLLGAAFLALALLLLAIRLYGSGTGPGPSPLQDASPYETTNGIIAFWEQRVRDNPGDFVAYNNLADGYLRRARETGDVSYYGRAEAAVSASLAELAAEHNYTALALKASLHNVKHEFEAARQAAERAIAIRPHASYGHAVLGDAQLALGQYDEAFTTYRELVEDGPSLTSFSRMAHIHELRGEVAQANAAWQNALNTDGGRHPENSAWARVQYGHFLFAQGKLDDAAGQYTSALEALPGYIHATAGQARIAASNEHYDEAIRSYTTVVERYPALEYVTALGDAYRVAGHDADAQRQYDLVAVINQLYKSNGINTDTEIAIFLADHPSGKGRLEDALAQAQANYAARPASIAAADALAWVLSKAGRNEEALVYSKEAVRLGTADPLLLFRAGMINFEAGNDDLARDYLTRATDANPRFSVLHADEAAGTLAELNPAVGGTR